MRRWWCWAVCARTRRSHFDIGEVFFKFKVADFALSGRRVLHVADDRYGEAVFVFGGGGGGATVAVGDEDGSYSLLQEL